MKNLFQISAVVILLMSSCSTAPEGFCECIEKGEELNVQTNLVLQGDASNADKQKMIDIRKEKNKLCADFETQSGPEMIKWKEACAN